MAGLSAIDLHLDLPVHTAGSRSLRSSLVDAVTGGRLQAARRMTVVQALRGVTLDLVDGDRLALVGRNGAGKSTLLRTLAGIYQPSRGAVVRRGRISTLFDATLGLDEEASGYENMRRLGGYLGLCRSEVARLQPEIAGFSELGPYLAMPLRSYSAGMRLRLAFAVATAIEPEVLLMDEVIGAGDHRFLAKAEERLARLFGRARILVLASHSDDMLRRFCNRAVLLHRGRIVAAGPVEEVLDRYQMEDPETGALNSF